MKKFMILAVSFVLMAVISPQVFALGNTHTPATPTMTAPAMPASSATLVSTDDNITNQIKNSILSDKSLSFFANSVFVKSENGTVTLTGFVNSEKDKLAIADKAKAIPGVNRVVNEIEIKELAR